MLDYFASKLLHSPVETFLEALSVDAKLARSFCQVPLALAHNLNRFGFLAGKRSWGRAFLLSTALPWRLAVAAFGALRVLNPLKVALERVVYHGVVHGHGVNLRWVPMAARMKAAPERALIYLDPPYLRGVLRRQDRPMYRHELTEKRHGQLLQLVKQLPCLVLVNHPRCELYEEWLGAWRTEDYRAMTRGAVMVEDCLWANYPAPTELQDYRCVGRNKRQRERVRRRVRNWVAALGRMGPLERGAILDAVDAEFGGR